MLKILAEIELKDRLKRAELLLEEAFQQKNRLLFELYKAENAIKIAKDRYDCILFKIEPALKREDDNDK